jgi:hypothetical protein
MPPWSAAARASRPLCTPAPRARTSVAICAPAAATTTATASCLLLDEIFQRFVQLVLDGSHAQGRNTERERAVDCLTLVERFNRSKDDAQNAGVASTSPSFGGARLGRAQWGTKIVRGPTATLPVLHGSNDRLSPALTTCGFRWSGNCTHLSVWTVLDRDLALRRPVEHRMQPAAPVRCHPTRTSKSWVQLGVAQSGTGRFPIAWQSWTTRTEEMRKRFVSRLWLVCSASPDGWTRICYAAKACTTDYRSASSTWP